MMITPIPNLNMKNHVAAELTRLHQEIERLRAALKTLEELGRHGMKPDYTEWLTFHDKVVQIAAAALDQQQPAKSDI